MAKKIECKLNDGSHVIIYGVEHWIVKDEMLIVRTKAWIHYILMKYVIKYSVEK